MIGIASVTAAYSVIVSGLALSASYSDQNSLSLAGLRNAQETYFIGNSLLRLKAYIWRDFMPMAVSEDSKETRAAVENARGMRASVQLIDENGTALPATLHAETMCIVQGDRVWETNAIEERRDESNSSICDLEIRKGPQWQPRSYVANWSVSLMDQIGLERTAAEPTQ
jgi:hypothetical protein